jgi:phosphoribosylformimino-5-aminoimidazole carboxamide ribotide isomerase
VIVIPAIDLHKGQVVRLRQGAFDSVTWYNKDPRAVALSFQKAGVKRIHVVDLDGSLKGKGVNLTAIESICRTVDVEIELGGGIRSSKDAQRAFDLGVDYVILGTIVVSDPEKAREIIACYPGKAGIGIDALNGRVAVGGWKEISEKSAFDLARELEGLNPAFIVYTDISRDGMLSGANIAATAALVRAVSIPVIASGGVASLDDLFALAAIPGLFGAITGKAVYEGRIDIKTAVQAIEK